MRDETTTRHAYTIPSLLLALALLLAPPGLHAQDTPNEPPTDQARTTSSTDDAESTAQEADATPLVDVTAGVTLTSRFIYRGLNLGEAPQVQPNITLRVGHFELTGWSSHPIAQAADESVGSPRQANYREVLFWALYHIDVGVGTLTPYIQNHYNPNTGRLFDMDDGGDGAHFLQAQLMFSGHDGWLPIDAMVGYVVYNDPGRSVYVEAGYRFSVDQVNLRAFAGGVPGKSPFNGVPERGAYITNVGLTATRAIPLTDRFELPLSVGLIFNPYTENAYGVFSLSL
ncbi:MAG: hypothetical protein AAGI71_18120 [Bacteroidota bacterium]